MFCSLKSNWNVLGIQLTAIGDVLSMKSFGRNFESFVLGTLENNEVTQEASSSGGKLKHSDQSFKNPGKSDSTIIKVKKNQIISFGLSNEKSDAGQQFVPFFDGSDVTIDSLSPLSGFGLLQWTTDEEYAGYISPFLITYNINAHLEKIDDKDFASGTVSVEADSSQKKIDQILLWVAIGVVLGLIICGAALYYFYYLNRTTTSTGPSNDNLNKSATSLADTGLGLQTIN